MQIRINSHATITMILIARILIASDGLPSGLESRADFSFRTVRIRQLLRTPVCRNKPGNLRVMSLLNGTLFYSEPFRCPCNEGRGSASTGSPDREWGWLVGGLKFPFSTKLAWRASHIDLKAILAVFECSRFIISGVICNSFVTNACDKIKNRSV